MVRNAKECQFLAAVHSDLESVFEIANTEFPGAWSMERLAALIDSDRGPSLWVARNEAAEVLGFAATQQVLDELEILAIAVSSLHRRRGIATQLFLYLLELEVAAVHLEVRERNLSARTFYERLGFEVVGRRSGYYREGEDALLMTIRRPATHAGLWEIR